MKIDNVPLSRKLWLTVIVTLLAMLVVTQWTQYRVRQTDRDAADRLEHQQELISLVSAWITMSAGNTNASLAAMASGEPAVERLMQDRMKANRGAGDELEERVQRAVTTGADKEAMAGILQRRAVVKDLLKQASDLKQSDTAAVLPFLASRFWPAVMARQEAMKYLLVVQHQQRDAVKAEAEAQVKHALVVGAISIALVAGLSLLWAAVLVRSINRPLQEAVRLAEDVAAGKLVHAAAPDRRDEIGRLLQAMSHMSGQLRSVVVDVRQGVGSVATASSQIAAGNLDLSTRTEQTASNLQQTVASLEQLAGTVTQTAEVAQQASRLADSAAESATRGGAVVAEVVSTMDRISEASRKIGDIIGVIDGIAFQTNILALNAAVEAAQAGEQGRGFAVVAGEVRTLAQRSAEAAKAIKGLIGNSVDAVKAGSLQVGQSSEVMVEIVANVRCVSDLITEMARATEKGRHDIRQVSSAVESIDQMTQQNAALVEQSSAAAMSLRDQATRLSEAVAIFQVEA
jgi:methyl-accepting chemotaxis protein